MEQLLKDGGATCCNYFVTSTTHLLCGTNFDESEIAQATDLYEVPSITEAWVIASAKLGRLATTKPYDPVPTKIFSQIFAAITQISSNDRNTLFALITYNGGIVERNFTNKTTHLICGSATGAPYQRSVTIKNENFCVVTPDWVVDCLNSREQLDPQSYHPRLLTGEPSPPLQLFKPTNTVSTPVTVANIMMTDGTGIESVDKQSLASILGLELDFEESIAKTEVPVGKSNEIGVSIVVCTLKTNLKFCY